MKKENISLFIALGLPMVLILVVALMSYLPSIISKSEYNFLYTKDYRSEQHFVFRDGQCKSYEKYYFVNKEGGIELRDFYISQSSEVDPERELADFCQGSPVVYQEAPDLYEFDFKTGQSIKVNPEDISRYKITSTRSSPDGYKVEYRYINNGIFDLFGSSNNEGFHLTKNNKPVRKLNLEVSNSYYYDRNFKWVGWILK
jgi:hypothetical protein